MEDGPVARSIANGKFAWSFDNESVGEKGRRGETEKNPESPDSRVA